MNQTFQYGPSESQVGDLHHLVGDLPPVVCLLHGGFWRMPAARDELNDVAHDLAARGFAVWNIEYRRVGIAGGGWPGTLQDVAAAVDHLAMLVADGIRLDLSRVVVVGHSAGGHLALRVAARHRVGDESFFTAKVHPIAAVALAGVVDLMGAHALSAGNGAVSAFLGGSPEQVPDRYAAASPMSLLPLGIKQLLVHGTEDRALPAELTRSYVRAAQDCGDDVEYVELPGAGHMDYIDPTSNAHSTLCRWLEDYLL